MKDFSQIETMCMDCLRQMAQPGGICEFCGFDNSAPRSPHHLPPRTILAGKYMTGRVLGEGGFGITYLGYDLNLDCRVAIKEYYPAGYVTRETTVRNTVTFLTGMNQDYYMAGMEKFLNEAKALAKFSELPGIVRVRDYFRENGTAYIAMDYIEGCTLAEELNRRGGRLPADEVLRKMEPLIRSLSVVHSSGVIHRDISPDNIMQNTRGELKLLDFGAARELASDQKSVAVMLKPGYAPEEQYRTKGEQGPWTDCYALCATMYKLITGVTPPEALERLAEDRLLPPSQLGANISPAVEEALMMGLAVKPEHRFKSMDALYNALYAGGVPAASGAAASSTAQAIPKSNPSQQSQSSQKAGKHPHSEPQKKKKAPIALIAALGVLAVAAIVAVVLLIKPGQNREVAANTPGPSVSAGVEPTPAPTPSYGGLLTPGQAPTPTPESGQQDPVLGTPQGTGPVMVPNFDVFSGFSPDEVNSGADGTRINRYEMSTAQEDLLIQYYLMLFYSDHLTLGYMDNETNLFYAQQEGGGYLCFNYNSDDEMLEIVAPPGVEIQVYDPPVTYTYLCDNGLDYEQWMMLGNTDYCDQGINYIGNTAGNILNEGCTAIQGAWLYFCDVNDTGYLYRFNFNTGDLEVVLAEKLDIVNLNVQSDYVYFVNYESGSDHIYALYRCAAAPWSTAELLRPGAKSACVIGGHIYFEDWSDGVLKRMDKDGRNEVEIFPYCGAYIVTASGVYVAHANGEGIYFFDHETLYPTKISDVDAYIMLLCGNYLYYRPLLDDSDEYIYRISKDGSGPRERITNVPVYEMNWDGQGLYFTSQDFAIYRTSLDGGPAVKLTDLGSNPVIHMNRDHFILFYRRLDYADSLMLYDWTQFEGVTFPE